MTSMPENAPDPVEATEPQPTTAQTRAVARRRRGRRRALVAGTSIGALALGVGSAVGVANAYKTVELDVDGETRTVTTFAGDVQGLLAEEGVEVGERDVVAPGVTASLDGESDVVVRTGKKLTVAVDGDEHDVWLTAVDASEALNLLHQRGSDVQLVASRSQDRAELPIELHDGEQVAVVHDGEVDVTDGSDDLGAVLDTTDVTVDDDDLVSVATAHDAGVTPDDLADLPDGADVPQVAVVVERVEVEKVKKTRAIDHDTVTEESAKRYEDLDPKVRTEGKDGVRTVVREVTTVDGKVVSSEKVSSKVTREPVTEVLVEGTKERPEPEPEPAATTSGATYSGSNRQIGQQMAAARGWTGSEWTCLESLWTRESGWSHTAANPSSGAYGIPQSLPGSKMATAGSDWQSNPATQIEWGLGYIADRYGSPCGAWAHSESVGWY
jgi:uncharacterized protein YabE (DUF348 family)